MSPPSVLTTVFEDSRATKRRLLRTTLTIIEGPQKGRSLVIEREQITVGRSVICDLVLEDKAVSGTHFEIVVSEQGVVLRDLDSTNGTHLGEIRVREVWLRPGMMIRAGETQMRFDAGSGEVEIDLSERERFHDLVGKSLRMREIFAVLEKVSPSDLTVLIRGQTGTGKELVARAIHRSSRRVEGPLVVQDCSAIPANLIESTLFGHERGAFTGAVERRRGSFEQAEGGTIFLDEIGELDITLQPKLLRVLENREIKRVGAERMIPVDVRVVAATNRDLRQMVNDGTFREDLYYRLGVVQIELPRLQDRAEDIPMLVRSFPEEHGRRRYPDQARRFSVEPDAMARLQAYAWPGNVRELKNTIERGVSLADQSALTLRDLMPSSQKTPPLPLPGGTAERFVEEGIPFKEAKQRVLETFEAVYLKVLLDQHDGNVTRSAKAAGLTRYHLRELAKRYGIRGRE
ncbi:MAG: sigma 54-interacting transcriptional regulator [Myxococcales bacterium]|nr:sigma 54-interacting transcriptional regulator [Myxococcales bacterium]